jgi:tight adherence protein B
VVSVLLLAAAALCWPGKAGRRPPLTPGAGVVPAGAAGHAIGRTGVAMTAKPLLPIVVAAGCGAAVVAFLVAGPAGLLAALMISGTTSVLVRQALAERRRRTALVDILAALRILGRELQAGADPGLAAANGIAVARGDGALVLTALTQLSRTEDRTAGAGLLAEVTDNSGTGGVRRQVVARLRGGWLLTRWHGLAFTPLVTALIQDLSEQLSAGSDRAGQVAGPRTSGYVMALLPLLGLALGAGMGADPVRVLTGSPIGNVLLLVGVGLTCTGLLWSARIVRS